VFEHRIGTASIAADLAAKTTLRCQEQVLADMLFRTHNPGWRPRPPRTCRGRSD
jgi:hypothetical protein